MGACMGSLVQNNACMGSLVQNDACMGSLVQNDAFHMGSLVQNDACHMGSLVQNNACRMGSLVQNNACHMGSLVQNNACQYWNWICGFCHKLHLWFLPPLVYAHRAGPQKKQKKMGGGEQIPSQDSAGVAPLYTYNLRFWEL
jgi:hypothetical protein